MDVSDHLASVLLQVDLADELYIDPPAKWLTTVVVVVHQLVGEHSGDSDDEGLSALRAHSAEHAACSKLLKSMLALDREL